METVNSEKARETEKALAAGERVGLIYNACPIGFSRLEVEKMNGDRYMGLTRMDVELLKTLPGKKTD